MLLAVNKFASEDMKSLFEEYDYLSYNFPEPQYLGAKYIHRGWIARFIPDDSSVALDAFGGSQSIAYLFKQLGKKTITNDFMGFNNQIGKALIENPGITLSKEDTDILFADNSNPEEFNLMQMLFANLFFTQDEAVFIDGFRSNVSCLNNVYKQSLALAVIVEDLLSTDM